MLYRVRQGQDEGWTIVNDRDYLAQHLDQSTFESAILSMLE